MTIDTLTKLRAARSCDRPVISTCSGTTECSVDLTTQAMHGCPDHVHTQIGVFRLTASPHGPLELCGLLMHIQRCSTAPFGRSYGYLPGKSMTLCLLKSSGNQNGNPTGPTVSLYWKYAADYSTDESDRKLGGQEETLEDRGHAQVVVAFFARMYESNLRDARVVVERASRNLIFWAFDSSDLSNPHFFYNIGGVQQFLVDDEYGTAYVNRWAPFHSGWSETLFVDNNRIAVTSPPSYENWRIVDALLSYSDATRDLRNPLFYGVKPRQPLYLIYHTVNAIGGLVRFAPGWVANPDFEVFHPSSPTLFRNWTASSADAVNRDGTVYSTGYHSVRLLRQLQAIQPYIEQRIYNTLTQSVVLTVKTYATNTAMKRHMVVLDNEDNAVASAVTSAAGWQTLGVQFSADQGKWYRVRLSVEREWFSLQDQPVWFDSFGSNL